MEGLLQQQQPLRQLECEETGSQRNILKYTLWFSTYLIKDHLLTIVTADAYWCLESYNLHCILLCTQRFQGGDQAPALLHDLDALRLRLFLVTFHSGSAGGCGGVRAVTDDI